MPYQPVVHGFRSRYGNNRWQCYSVKLQRQVNLYSDLEYHYWILIETDPEVIEYCEQPIRVSMRKGSRLRHTTFDFWIKQQNGEERFVETKYSHEIDINSKRASLRSINQVALQQEWCDYYGHTYTLITEQDVYSNPLFLKNKKRILSLVSERVEDEYIKTIRNSLGASPMTVSAILNNHVDLQPLRAQITVAHMLFQGILSADLEITEYGLNSTVWVPNREGTNSF